MNTDHDSRKEWEITTHLDALGQTMTQRGFTAHIVWPGNEPPYVRVVNPEADQLAEDIRCASVDGEPWFLWSWRRPITPVDQLELAADQIAHVLSQQ